MITPKQENCEDICLLGAVNISNHSFFVFKNADGTLVLQSAKEENSQKNILRKMMLLNPRIRRLLQCCRIKPSIDTKILKDLSVGHMNDTCKIASGIYEFLSSGLKNQIDITKVKVASMLHDVGKVFIPSKILNKPTKLSNRERRIMNIHSTLGYELLKTQNIDGEVLDLVKYHHQNLNRSGYPAIYENHNPSALGVQIISIADKYSALREARVYRKRLSQVESLAILYKEVREGKIHKEVYDALVSYVGLYDCN